jgi:hypothetical protein
MTYIQWVHAEPLQLVQGTEQVPGETHLLWGLVQIKFVTYGTTPPNQVRLANGYRDPHPMGVIYSLAVLPTAMIRYMVVVLAR